LSDQVVKEVTDAEFSENASEVLLDEIAFVWEKKKEKRKSLSLCNWLVLSLLWTRSVFDFLP
jgi:hypothetical protein